MLPTIDVLDEYARHERNDYRRRERAGQQEQTLLRTLPDVDPNQISYQPYVITQAFAERGYLRSSRGPDSGSVNQQQQFSRQRAGFHGTFRGRAWSPCSAKRWRWGYQGPSEPRLCSLLLPGAAQLLQFKHKRQRECQRAREPAREIGMTMMKVVEQLGAIPRAKGGGTKGAKGPTSKLNIANNLEGSSVQDGRPGPGADVLRKWRSGFVVFVMGHSWRLDDLLFAGVWARYLRLSLGQ